MKNPLAIKAFGVHLRQLREEKMLSMQKLADLADVAKSTLYRFENGKMVPTLDAIVSIAKALDIEPSDLTRFPVPKEKPAKKS